MGGMESEPHYGREVCGGQVRKHPVLLRPHIVWMRQTAALIRFHGSGPPYPATPSYHFRLEGRYSCYKGTEVTKVGADTSEPGRKSQQRQPVGGAVYWLSLHTTPAAFA